MKYEKSCGCVVVNEGKMLLIKQVKGHWSFPKGHVEVGETEEETAIREVFEETHVNVSIMDGYRYKINYHPNGDTSISKDVVFFIATPLNFDTKAQDEEVALVKWVPFDEVEDLLTYDDTKRLFRDVISYLKK